MKLRTITFWVLYIPAMKHIVATRRFRYEVAKLHRPAGAVLVKMKGHYVLPYGDSCA